MSLKRASTSEGGAPEPKRHAPTPSTACIRALVEASLCARIIGPRGDTLKRMRKVSDETGALNAHISPENGASARVISVSGSTLAVSKFFGVLVRHVLEEDDGPATSESRPYNLRVLVPNSLMGKVIGTKMSVMLKIQEESGAALSAERDILPRSDDRLVNIYGVCDAIHIAVFHIGEIYCQNSAGKGREYIPDENDPVPGGERGERSDRRGSGGRGGRSERGEDIGTGAGGRTEVGKRLNSTGPSPSPAGSTVGIELHIPETAPRALQTAFETAKQSKKSSIRQIVKIKSGKLDKLVRDIAQVTESSLTVLDDDEGTVQLEGPPEENQLAIFLAFRHLKKLTAGTLS